MSFRFPLVILTLSLLWAAEVSAQVLGRATGDFSNARYNRSETAFGRLVADSFLNATKADCALVNAGALRSGTLESGPVEQSDLEPFFSFGEDELVVVDLSGQQLRAALERAASVYPTGSPAFLHCAGLRATFNPKGSAGRRLISLQIQEKNVENQNRYQVAMPISLAHGAAGYFKIWNGAQSKGTQTPILNALSSYFSIQKTIEPVGEARFGVKE